MSGSKPLPTGGKPPEDEADADAEQKSGRVTFDERGNAVWEWAMSTGIFGRNVDTKRLKKLEAHELKIAEEPAAATKPVAPPRQPGGGIDPYNSAGANLAPARKHKNKPKDLKRLGEWIRLQKSAGKKPDEE